MMGDGRKAGRALRRIVDGMDQPAGSREQSDPEQHPAPREQHRARPVGDMCGEPERRVDS